MEAAAGGGGLFLGGVGAHAGAGGTAEEEEERAGRAALRKEVVETGGICMCYGLGEDALQKAWLCVCCHFDL